MSKFDELFALNVNDKVEKRKDGSTELSYLSWAWAWAKFKKVYPEATYKIKKFEHYDNENFTTLLPYIYDKNTGYMVFTEITADGLTYEMYLPVMNSANKAMKNEPYTYKVKEYEYKNGKPKWTGNYIDKEVEAATMFDINKTIMRCLVKNMAMFGLGLYIYAGEDLPEQTEEVLEMMNVDTKALKNTETEKEETLESKIRNCKTKEELQKLYRANKANITSEILELMTKKSNSFKKAS